MEIDFLFTLLALVFFAAAGVVSFIHKSWSNGLFCVGVTFLVIAYLAI